MRFLSYQTDAGPRLGVLQGDRVFPLPGQDMLGLLEAGPAGLEAARAAIAAGGQTLALAALTLLAPIPMPRRNIFCVGLNYMAHGRESAEAKGEQFTPPAKPLFFTKGTLAINAHNRPIEVDDAVSPQVDWEVELGVVLGKRGKNIQPGDALSYVFGYTVINDVSARDVQMAHGGQFFKGKSLDGLCPMGPVIVTADEIADPHGLRVQTRVNGVTKQDSNTSDLIFNIPTLIDWLSRGMTLLPGDIIATGTPAGVGFARTPAEFLRPGDVVECEIDHIGILRNPIIAAA
ncbi:MAG: fumarylacetoacetate hydrolase family protein [Anaerolineales bacterium]|nr:fumarylacetoacetate hydrolase family protein [Anaerolineales bacterium]